MKRICLEFNKATTRLAGNPYGKTEFQKQVKEIIDYDDINVIVFPMQIEKVASSFTQGFFAEVIERVGYANFDKVIEIEAKDDKLADSIHCDLFA